MGSFLSGFVLLAQLLYLESLARLFIQQGKPSQRPPLAPAVAALGGCAGGCHPAAGFLPVYLSFTAGVALMFLRRSAHLVCQVTQHQPELICTAL